VTQKLVYDGLQACPYLPGQVARMPLYRQLRRLTLDETDRRLQNAERRVGTCLYRTACPTCQACEGIRIPVEGFSPTKSQRRVAKRWEGRSRVEIGPVTLTEEKLALFNRHKRERGLAQPDDEEMTPLGYASWLVHSCLLTVEMRYYHDEKLVGVGVVDLGRRAASSVYFYFDPDASPLSPGTWSVLQELELCRKTGRSWLYLGLYVGDCRSLSYKADFKPHERLVDGHWRTFT
jgi:arginyl-tRNA--protein-N-Asp/Glu arginylyltransferase